MLDYTEKFDLLKAFDGCLAAFRETDTDAIRVCTVQHGHNLNMVVVVRGRAATADLLKRIERLMDRWDRRVKAKGI